MLIKNIIGWMSSSILLKHQSKKKEKCKCMCNVFTSYGLMTTNKDK